eukprot:366130-Chlamydomonas_euryale.AAC.28
MQASNARALGQGMCSMHAQHVCVAGVGNHARYCRHALHGKTTLAQAVLIDDQHANQDDSFTASWKSTPVYTACPATSTRFVKAAAGRSSGVGFSIRRPPSSPGGHTSPVPIRSLAKNQSGSSTAATTTALSSFLSTPPPCAFPLPPHRDSPCMSPVATTGRALPPAQATPCRMCVSCSEYVGSMLPSAATAATARCPASRGNVALEFATLVRADGQAGGELMHSASSRTALQTAAFNERPDIRDALT